jgi:CDP-glucose 4,6-dehydratase
MTARAGNVIGGGDFSKDRIIPDFFRALKKKKFMFVHQRL